MAAIPCRRVKKKRGFAFSPPFPALRPPSGRTGAAVTPPDSARRSAGWRSPAAARSAARSCAAPGSEPCRTRTSASRRRTDAPPSGTSLITVSLSKSSPRNSLSTSSFATTSTPIRHSITCPTNTSSLRTLPSPDATCGQPVEPVQGIAPNAHFPHSAAVNSPTLHLDTVWARGPAASSEARVAH